MREKHHGADVGPAGSRELRVLVLAQYPPRTSPSQRFRFEQYIERLKRYGIHLDVSSYLAPTAVPVLHWTGNYGAKVGAVLSDTKRRVRDLVSKGEYDVALVQGRQRPSAISSSCRQAGADQR